MRDERRKGKFGKDIVRSAVNSNLQLRREEEICCAEKEKNKDGGVVRGVMQ